MKYWLVKFAPYRFSWSDCLFADKFEIYSVRSYQARNNLKAMAMEDIVLFYHSQGENRVMGEMEVVETAHQDKTTVDTRWVSVTFAPTLNYEMPITLREIKLIEGLSNIGLIRQPRLSVMPLSPTEYNIIRQMGNSK